MTFSTTRVATRWQGGWQPLPNQPCHAPYVVEGAGMAGNRQPGKHKLATPQEHPAWA